MQQIQYSTMQSNNALYRRNIYQDYFFLNLIEKEESAYLGFVLFLRKKK